jgi:dihydrofolate reductase
LPERFRPLPDRTNIVVTRQADWVSDGVRTVHSLEDALAHAGGQPTWVIGGAQIFAELLPSAARLEITRVHATPEGDTYFPPVDAALWQEIAHAEYPAGASDDAAFTVLTYRRVQRSA